MKQKENLKFQLSPQFQFIPREDIADFPIAEIQKVKNGELHLLLDHETDEILLLNPTIYEFLCLFSSPIIPNSVATYFAEKESVSKEEVTPILNQFFSDMTHRGILIQEKKKVTKVIEHLVLAENTTVGNYQLGKSLSKNGLTELFKAVHITTNQEVVIKFFPNKPTRGETEKWRYWQRCLTQEFSILKTLKAHPSVCQHLETINNEHFTGEVVEFFNGLSLKRFFTEHTLSFENNVRIFTQILDFYAFLHSQKIVHGDVHLSNFLVKEDMSVKVIDFEMSYHCPPKRGEIVREGGVHEFIPPEKISSNAFDLVTTRSDFRSEVFQLGIVGYFIFYGTLPFSGTTWLALANQIKTVEPSFEPTIEAKGSPAITLFLKKALQKSPKTRFSSAIEMYNSWRAASFSESL